MDAAKTRTIVKLEAENVKRLKAVSIEPNGNVVVIGGANAQGKSSVLDSIAMAIGGKRLCPSQPIRNGEASARISIDLGDLKVERRFTASGSTLKVVAKDGATYPSPQSLLDEMVSTLTFDPLEFYRSTKQEQVSTLQKVAGIDLSDLEDEYKKVYDERVQVGREQSKAEGHASGLKVQLGSLEDVPDEEVSVKDLLQEVEIANEINAEAKEAEAGLYQCQNVLNAAKEAIEEHEEELKELRATVAEYTAALPGWEAAVNMSKHVDVQEILERIEKAEETNAVKRNCDRLREAEEKVRDLVDKYNRCSLDLRELKEKMKRRIEAANMPLEGMWIDEGEIYMNGVPVDQLSSAERLRLSVAMGFAINPKLKVMRIEHGSLLDAENLNMLAEMAEQENGQLWIERVGNGEEVSVLIHDGEVV